jgi:hypothetical protein
MTRFQDPVLVDQRPAQSLQMFQAPFRCGHCRRLSIGELWGRKHEGLDTAKSVEFWDRDGVKWTPKVVGGKEFPDVPTHIASAADEAYQCRSISAFRASILLARGVVEAVAKDCGATKGTLHDKIEELSASSKIRQFTRDAAHELRFLGNDMAHGDFIEPVDSDDAESVLDVMSEILNEVYQGPARVRRMKQKRTSPPDEPPEDPETLRV